MSDETTLLFLCVANSARSQMAEGLARALAPPGYRVFSAGSEPSRPNPYAVAAMADRGIDISAHTSKSVDDIPAGDVDVVVTLCKEEFCPVFLGHAERHHWPLPDPANPENAGHANAQDDAITASFAAVRDEIEARVVRYFAARSRVDAVIADPRLDRALLDRHGFDRARFAEDARRLAYYGYDPDAVRFSGTLAPVEDVVAIRWDDATIRARGEAALRAGRVAVVVLNGGMATRFGNIVKGTVAVFDDQSFLALKGADVARAAAAYGASIPLVLMNSFATAAATAQHVEAHSGFGLAPQDILTFEQTISIRLTPEADLFVGRDGKPSYHAPGHGDFFAAIRSSGVLDDLKARGVTVVLFSNVDNLGATVDPVVIGEHLTSGKDMTAEVTAKRQNTEGKWDAGGAPTVADGQRQLMEGFRFPAHLPPTFLPDFSTNNFVFSIDALDRDVALPRHTVMKTVDGRAAVQFESITCEASGIYRGDVPLFSLHLLRVPRDGPSGRFFPVKERVDLEAQREILRDRLHAGWLARDA